MPEQPGPANERGTSVGNTAALSRATMIDRCVSAGGGGPPEPSPEDKLCDHCLQVQPRPCPRYDQHDTHECPCDYWNSQREKEKHEQWKCQWESVFDQRHCRLDEWEAQLHNYFADLSEEWQKDKAPQFVPSIAECQELAGSVIPAVEHLSPYHLPSSNQ